jgi:hypothetical protein
MRGGGAAGSLPPPLPSSPIVARRDMGPGISAEMEAPSGIPRGVPTRVVSGVGNAEGCGCGGVEWSGGRRRLPLFMVIAGLVSNFVYLTHIDGIMAAAAAVHAGGMACGLMRPHAASCGKL